jgi:hypothetical protein
MQQVWGDVEGEAQLDEELRAMQHVRRNPKGRA